MPRSKKKVVLVAAAAVAVMVVAACSGSSNGSSGGGGKTIKVGVLTDQTGLAASGNKTSVDGVKAGIEAAKKDGYTISYVTADTTTSPAGALSAAQKLVQQDRVDVVVAVSAVAFGAAQYLTQKGVPVVGVAEDGPEWITAKNMFSVYGALHTEKVATTYGKFMKSQGVTTIGGLGYSISPSSAQVAKASKIWAENAGLKSGYVNANFPFGSTDVQPVALAMKSAGVDGLVPSTDPNTAFALIGALRNLGVNLKVALLPTGYGGDLLQAGPGALQAAQNVFFTSAFEPVEMKTDATKAFESALSSAGVKTEPTYAEYAGYTSILLLVEGLKLAGSDTSSTGITKGLSQVTDFTAGGLFGDHKLNVNDRENLVSGVDNCQWIVQLSGDAFKLVDGADPVCGELIQGQTVK